MRVVRVVCAVSRKYIDVYNCDMFSVVNVCLDHLSSVLCVLMVEGVYVVVNAMFSLFSVMSPLLHCTTCQDVRW